MQIRHFKLIKNYPSCLFEVGHIITFEDGQEWFGGLNIKLNIENFPEFWAPVGGTNDYLSHYDNENNIGTVHWFASIGGTAKHCAEFIRDNPTHENTSKYADRIVKCFKDFFTAQKQGLIKLR